MQEAAKFVWNEILKPFKEWILNEFAPVFAGTLAEGIKTATTAFTDLGDILRPLWNDTLKPILQDIGNIAKDLADDIKDAFSYLNEKLGENKDEIALVAEAIGFAIRDIWTLIKPILELLNSQSMTTFKNVTDGVFALTKTFSDFYGFIKETIGGIGEIFKGNYDDAEKHLKKGLSHFLNFFIGIGNLIISAVNELWSLIFNAFKGAVNAIAGIANTVGNWLGFDWNLQWNEEPPLIPQIPYYEPPEYASGTVVPPNTRHLAWFGDNTREPEVVSPVSTMKQAFADVLAEAGGGSPIALNVYLDGDVVYSTVVERNKLNTIMTGQNALA